MLESVFEECKLKSHSQYMFRLRTQRLLYGSRKMVSGGEYISRSSLWYTESPFIVDRIQTAKKLLHTVSPCVCRWKRPMWHLGSWVNFKRESV